MMHVDLDFAVMWTSFRSFAKWVYNWITVIVATGVGGTSMVFDALDALTGTDLTPVLPPAHAAQIITVVAIAKAVHATRASRKDSDNA